MKKESEVREKIAEIEQDGDHLINRKGENVMINAPVALMQLAIKSKLEILYWLIGEKRPKKPYDNIND